MRNLRMLALLVLPAAMFACSAAPTQVVMPTLLAVSPASPVVTSVPANTSEPSAAPAPTLPALSFTPATYKAPSLGYALDYPADWTAVPVEPVGPRGSQGLLFSPGSSADTLAEGGTRVAMTIYQWDPKNDLAAFTDHRKEAWSSGGFSIVKEDHGNLVDRPYSSFVIQTPDQHQAFFLLTTLGDQYLEVAGEGNLALAEEIARTVRPLGQ